MNEANIPELKRIASQVRRDIVRMVHAVNSGHPGGSLGCTDFLVALYFDAMKRKDGFDPEEFKRIHWTSHTLLWILAAIGIIIIRQ